MLLDVYVMPMWRFKAGDVETAAQRLFGGQGRIVTPQGILSPRRIKGILGRFRAKRQVKRIIAEAESELSTRLQWNDDGDVVHAEQASFRFAAIRAYAKWLDLQDHFPKFEAAPKDNFYKHPAMKWDEEPERGFRFSHIIDHGCNNGYYVPCHFELVVYVEPFEAFGRFKFRHSFGSSHTLARQLVELEQHLPPKDRHEMADESDHGC